MVRPENMNRVLSIRQKAPSAIRCIKTATQIPRQNMPDPRQKAPSAIRCIKTSCTCLRWALFCSFCQKAPSAVRCIKTAHPRQSSKRHTTEVRKHRAPPNLACISLSSNFNERRKSRHLNSVTSSLEGVEAELHATFSNNPAISAP